MWRSQVLPGYPHSSAGTYDDGYWSRMQTIFKLFNEWVWLGSRVYYCGCKCTWFQHYRQDPVRNENKVHWEQVDAKHLRWKIATPHVCMCNIIICTNIKAVMIIGGLTVCPCGHYNGWKWDTQRRSEGTNVQVEAHAQRYISKEQSVVWPSKEL